MTMPVEVSMPKKTACPDKPDARPESIPISKNREIAQVKRTPLKKDQIKKEISSKLFTNIQIALGRIMNASKIFA
jgi:hypothetical protein